MTLNGKESSSGCGLYEYSLDSFIYPILLCDFIYLVVGRVSEEDYQ